ncbi:acidic fibroblast growth factor intracellular-binding protein B-like isoform X2 [Oscarella lobularis]|uniref:acidic fibroblast growth factor intracellular-binding protein B-like isoform X2 n=1 Tax=Oscarella lobularis TaxID=121494 RepID=UPI0033132619
MPEVRAELSVFVSDPIVVDESLFALWLSGLSAKDAAEARKGKESEPEVSDHILLLDTIQQFSTFAMLEQYLQHPSKLETQTIFQIAPESRQMLLRKYYSYDAAVIREFIGKKLTSRNRKDLDDVSEKTRIPIRSCRRQFDNVKRIFRAVEDLEGSLFANVCKEFLLPESLARKYACFAFISDCRFETGKKRLAYLTLDDFIYCANEMIQNWTYGMQVHEQTGEPGIDLDRQFLHFLADLKGELGDKDVLEQYRNAMKPLLVEAIPGSQFRLMDTNVKSFFKTLLKIGEGLVHSKDLKDFFSDIVEKFVEPCRGQEIKKESVECFLRLSLKVSRQLPPLRQTLEAQTVFERYMTTVQCCILRVY